jgi:hypothetical protein
MTAVTRRAYSSLNRLLAFCPFAGAPYGPVPAITYNECIRNTCSAHISRCRTLTARRRPVVADPVAPPESGLTTGRARL